MNACTEKTIPVKVSTARTIEFAIFRHNPFDEASEPHFVQYPLQ